MLSPHRCCLVTVGVALVAVDRMAAGRVAAAGHLEARRCDQCGHACNRWHAPARTPRDRVTGRRSFRISWRTSPRNRWAFRSTAPVAESMNRASATPRPHGDPSDQPAGAVRVSAKHGTVHPDRRAIAIRYNLPAPCLFQTPRAVRVPPNHPFLQRHDAFAGRPYRTVSATRRPITVCTVSVISL